MTHAFKVRYANILVGGLVLLVLTVLVVGTIFIGSRKHWFQNPYTIQGNLPFRRTLGLKEGTPVCLMDANVGAVSKINYHTNGQAVITMTINAIFKPFIRTNAVGIVRKEFGVVGEQSIFLEQEEVGPTYADFEKLPPMKIDPDIDIVATLIAAAEEISKQLPDLVADGRTTVSNVMTLTGQLSDPKDGVKPLVVESTALLKDIRQILQNVQAGDGVAAKVLNDPKFSADVHQVVTELSATMKEVQATLRKVQKLSDSVDPILVESQTTVKSINTILQDSQPLVKSAAESMEKVPSVLSGANKALTPVPNTLWELNSMLEELNLLLRGLQRNWLLEGGVEEAKEDDKASRKKSETLLIP